MLIQGTVTVCEVKFKKKNAQPVICHYRPKQIWYRRNCAICLQETAAVIYVTVFDSWYTILSHSAMLKCNLGIGALDDFQQVACWHSGTDNRTFRSFDVSPPGRFAPSLDVSPLGRFATWRFRPLTGHFAPNCGSFAPVCFSMCLLFFFSYGLHCPS